MGLLLQLRLEIISLLKSWNASDEQIWLAVGLFDLPLDMKGNEEVKLLSKELCLALELLKAPEKIKQGSIPLSLIDVLTGYVIVQLQEVIKRRPVKHGKIVPLHPFQERILDTLCWELVPSLSDSTHWDQLQDCVNQLLPNGVSKPQLSDNHRPVFKIQFRTVDERMEEKLKRKLELIEAHAKRMLFETSYQGSLLYIAPHFRDEALLWQWLLSVQKSLSDYPPQLWEFSKTDLAYSTLEWEHREIAWKAPFNDIALYFRDREQFLKKHPIEVSL